MFFKYKRVSSEFKDDGFLLIDSLISLMTLVIITNVLLPALIALVEYENISKAQLNFNRELFISMAGYEDFDEFKEKNDKFIIEQGEICDKEKDICIRITR